MNYEPNWRDPRVIKRTLEVLEWCHFMLTPIDATPVHSSKIKAVFGPTSNSFSAYLRNRLLIADGKYLPGVLSIGYRLNLVGVKALRKALDGSVLPDLYSTYMDRARISNPVVDSHEEELRTLSFKYTESSDRHWHPLQNIRREAKPDFWARYGFPYDYDIEACAPTVLLQLAQRHSLPAVLTSGVQEYLTHKQEFRQRFAEISGLEARDAKRLLNSLFNGARLVPHWKCSAYVLLGYDAERLARVKNDPEVRSLIQGIKRIWDRIAFATKLDLTSGKVKWALYFKWERQIMDVVRDELNEQKIQFFTEHDGFRTTKPIDKKRMTDAIEAKTKLKLKISGPDESFRSSHSEITSIANVEYKSGIENPGVLHIC